MIYRNKRDQEAWLREKSLESLKANTFLQENDIVQVAENSNFYKVVTTTTPIPLQNELFAQAMPSELAGNIETASKLKTPAKIELTGDALGSVMFDGSENVKLTVEVLDDSHTHNTQYNTKAEITEIKTALENKDTQLTQEINTAKQDISNLKTSDAKKANSNINITAGKGLTGGGDLTANRNFDIVSANEGILVNADNIELNVVDDLVTGGAKRPLSAEQGKVLKQLLDTIGTGGASQLFRNARTLGELDLVGQLGSNARSITAGKRLYKPVLYLDGIRIDKNMYDVNLDNGLITLKEPYSKYEVTWVIEDEYPNYIKLSFPTLNMLVNDEATKAEIELGDVIEIQGESEAGDGGHRLVKCENSSKLNGVSIGAGKFLNEIPNTRTSEKLDKGGYNGTAKNLSDELNKKASKSQLGRVIVGDNLTVDGEGRISGNPLVDISGKLDKGSVSAEYDTAKKIEDKVKNAQSTADSKFNKGSVPAAIPDMKAFYDLVEKGYGAEIDPNLLYLNDAGTKTAGKLYFDRNKKGLFKCVQTTSSTTNSTTYFVDASPNANSDRLSNLYEYKFEKISSEHWILYLIKQGNIGLCIAESTSNVNRSGQIMLPSWFKPKHYASAAVGGDVGLTGEIYISPEEDQKSRFAYYVESEMSSGQPYSGEIIVILN